MRTSLPENGRKAANAAMNTRKQRFLPKRGVIPRSDHHLGEAEGIDQTLLNASGGWYQNGGAFVLAELVALFWPLDQRGVIGVNPVLGKQACPARQRGT